MSGRGIGGTVRMRSAGGRFGLAVLVGALGAALLAAAAFPGTGYAAKTRISEGLFGTASQPSFVKSMGLAADHATGDVLVIDQGAKTVSRWHADGTASNFSGLGGNTIDGKLGPGGKPCAEEPASCDVTPENGLVGFGSFAEEIQVAVDDSGTETDGNIYVTQAAKKKIYIFSSSGNYVGQLTGFDGTGLGEACGVAVDEDGTVYVGDYTNNQIHKYIAAGPVPVNADHVTSFVGIEHPCTMAAGAGPTAGFLFVNKYLGPTYKVDAATGAIAYIVSQGIRTTVAVDPLSGSILVAGKGNELREYNATGSDEATLIYPAFSFEGAVRGITAGATAAYAAVEGSPNLHVYSPLEEALPRIEDQWLVKATSTGGVVKARFGPEEQATTYRVEYLTLADFNANGGDFIGPRAPMVAPVPEGEVGAQSTVAVILENLQAKTHYRWRFVATSPAGVTEGGAGSLTTHIDPDPSSSCRNREVRIGTAAGLPNCRAYEMVSPVDKNGGDINAYVYEGLDAERKFSGLDQSTIDGDKLTFTASSLFARPDGSPAFAQYLASRAETGWSTMSIDPPMAGGAANLPTNSTSQFKVFSPDLCEGWLIPESGLPLTGEATPGFRNIYRRHNCTGAPTYTWLKSSAEEPEPCPDPECDSPFLFPDLQGVSADGRCAVFRVNDALTSDAPEGIAAGARTAAQLYLQCEDSSLRLVSKEPDGDPLLGSSSAGTETGSLGPGTPGARGEGHIDTVENALSDDGSRVYWTGSSEAAPKLYLRVNASEEQSASGCEPAKACTLQVSPNGFESLDEAQFWTASATGERAVFSVIAGPDKGNLYEYNFNPAEAKGVSTKLAGKALGVAGSSEEATRVYFASEEVCSGAKENSEGDMAEAGKANLYLYETGESCAAGEMEFIGALAGEDVSTDASFSFPSPVTAVPRDHIARATPDGEHLTFVSAAPLTGYDNADVESGQSDRQVFLYDAGTGELSCASCNPTEARPQGANLANSGAPLWTAAYIPGYQHQLYGRRPLSEDGNRLFFNSLDALALRDVNGAQDVYQWEAPGTGSCTTTSSSYSAQNEGCVDLISSGKSPRDSEWVEASADGDDVFFRTESSLAGKDPGSVDIYDARVGGGFPEPSPPPACEGDSCQSVPAAPSAPAPASQAYRGPGNASASGPSPCAAPTRKAKRLGRAATRLRRAARRAEAPARSRSLRRRARGRARAARRHSARAKRCRRARVNQRSAR